MNSLFKCIATAACHAALLLAFFPCASAENPDAAAADLIHDAWKEYQYREFDSAQAIFAKAFKKSSVKAEKLQALTGQAFCLQFGKRALAGVSDYEGAIAIYRKALAICEHDPKFESFFNSMIAECSYRIYSLNGDEAKLKEAEGIWQALSSSEPKSLVAQDALLFRTFAGTNSFAEDANVEKMNQVASYLASVSQPGVKPEPGSIALASVMANYLATVCFWRGDYKGSVDWLKEYVKLGPTSYASRTNTVFRIARISDVKLGDAKTAAEYYGIFAKSFPVDNRRYFSELKAASLLGKEAGN